MATAEANNTSKNKWRRLQDSPLSSFSQFMQSVWQTTTSLLDCFGGGTDSNFTIALDLTGVDDKSEFQSAVDKWRQVIVGDIPDFNGELGGSSTCGPWPTSIDDVYICGKYSAIDGPGNVLGRASPRHYRPSEGIPLTGEMTFDTDDVEKIEDLSGIIVSSTIVTPDLSLHISPFHQLPPLSCFL